MHTLYLIAYAKLARYLPVLPCVYVCSRYYTLSMAYCVYCMRPKGVKCICTYVYTPTVQHLSYMYAHAYKPIHSSIENPKSILASLVLWPCMMLMKA